MEQQHQPSQIRNTYKLKLRGMKRIYLEKKKEMETMKYIRFMERIYMEQKRNGNNTHLLRYEIYVN